MSSYNHANFQLGRGAANCEALPLTVTYHSYSTTDTMATVIAADYFPAYFGFTAEDVIDGDFVLIQASDQIGGFTVSAVATAPVLSDDRIPTGIVTESTGSFDTAFGGPYTAPLALTIPWILQGSIITLDIPAFGGTFNSAAPLTSTIAMPAELRPQFLATQSMNVENNSVDVPGNIYVQTNGILVISTYLSSGNFTAGTVGIRKNLVRYSLL